MKGKKHGEKADISRQELEELRAKAAERDEYYNKWLNVHADYENTRKRLEKEKSEFAKFANEGIVSRLFPIVDNFDMALAAMETAQDKMAVMDGIKLVQKEFHRILEENGVRKIEAQGKPFDPNFEEAVFMEETEEYPEGFVTEEVRAGYTLNGRLLRPAQVKVAKNIRTTDNGQQTTDNMEQDK